MHAPGPFARAEFTVSVANARRLPADLGSEVAFAGRSNAGKSSAINALTGHVGLARVSKLPGRTRQINFFDLDDRRRLVDLPGYGFARAPASERQAWAGLIEAYLSARKSLRGVVVLMDVRRPCTDLDLTLLEWLEGYGVPAHLVLTKADKLSRGAGSKSLTLVRKRAEGAGASASVQLLSAKKWTGVDTLRARVADWLDLTP
ncbi:MAG: ribosome biogenesis GTP-binding protein YihA/YsxC [Gammaproteobacteria bacterium]